MMKNSKLAYWGLLVLLSGLWLAADALPSSAFLALRTSLINYTGIIGIGAMSAALILAARPIVFEPVLGGLDKMYRLHKWLGITGLIFIIAHWLLKESPSWLVDLGWIARPVRVREAASANPFFVFLSGLREAAESIGEWAFYAAVLLIVLALVKQFPYRYFFKTHRLLAVTYLFLVFHSVVLMKTGYWSEALGPVILLLMVAGSIAALLILLRKVGLSRRSVGVVERVVRHAGIRVLEVSVQIKGHWQGHMPGQFAFVTFDSKEGAHPFTVSSAWKGDGHILFLIKELGDYTRALPNSLRVGAVVQIEGPYGQFNFASDKARQTWVGGGIGITPFVARMNQLAQHADGKVIDLFYATGACDEQLVFRLRRSAERAGVNLHVLVDGVDGRLDAAQISQLVPDWRSGDIWFCGPFGFGHDLRRDFTAMGLRPGDFHQELFSLR